MGDYAKHIELAKEKLLSFIEAYNETLITETYPRQSH